MAAITAKHKIDTVITGTENARVNSLIEGGPLKVGTENWLAKSLDKSEFDTSYGDMRIELHKVEYMFLNAFLWCEELKNRSMPWKVQPQRVSRFLAEADNLGKLEDGKTFNIEQMTFYIEDIARTMPDALRHLLETEVWATPTAQDDLTCYFYRLKPTAFMLAGEDMRTVIDIKGLFSDGYVKSRRDDANGHFQTVCAIILDAAGEGLEGKPTAIQASRVEHFLRTTCPESTACATADTSG